MFHEAKTALGLSMQLTHRTGGLRELSSGELHQVTLARMRIDEARMHLEEAERLHYSGMRAEVAQLNMAGPADTQPANTFFREVRR